MRIRSFLKEKHMEITMWIVTMLLFLTSFALFHLPMKAVLYPMALSSLLAFGCLVAAFFREKSRHKEFGILHMTPREALAGELPGLLPASRTQMEEDYRELTGLLCRRVLLAESQAGQREADMVDYYTMWVHQIKTPIAAMRLTLEQEDSAVSRRLKKDLGRIEEYVAMVLTYLRLDSESTDYVIREYEVDELIRPVIKRFAGEFILKKLSLVYEPVHEKVLTDAKWMQFVLGQILSNALKYTEQGGITITWESTGKTAAEGAAVSAEGAAYSPRYGTGILRVQDTGIGISAEDLPRIFERGYTGFNGRVQQKASGIGLFLCKRICDKLGHGICARSGQGEGTTLALSFEQKVLPPE